MPPATKRRTSDSLGRLTRDLSEVVAAEAPSGAGGRGPAPHRLPFAVQLDARPGPRGRDRIPCYRAWVSI